MQKNDPVEYYTTYAVRKLHLSTKSISKHIFLFNPSNLAIHAFGVAQQNWYHYMFT